MVRKNNLIILAFLVCMPVWLAVGQLGVLMSGRGTLGDGTRVNFSTVSDPPGLHGPTGGGFEVEGQTVHRFFVDRPNALYFGYDLHVSPMTQTRQFRISIGPLKLSEEELTHLSQGQTLNAAPNPRFPLPQFIQDADTIALDVLVNSSTRQKIIDRITISSQEARYSPTEIPSKDAVNNEPPRDFALDDVEFQMTDSILVVDGKMATFAQGQISGPMLWIYVPGKGRFLLSIRPRDEDGFAKTGSIQGRQLTFRVDRETYEWRSQEPILGGKGNWNLYVLNQPSFSIGAGAGNTFALGGTDRIK